MKYECNKKVLLPGWHGDEPFEAVLKRPSLLAMAATGIIPNELMGAAQKLFNEGCDSSLEFDKLGALLLAVAKEALVEPTFAELEAANCPLTDMQLAAIYSFTQAGVRALEPFRFGGTASESACDEQALQHSSE